MPRLISVGHVCERMAELAKANRLKSLSMWLKMAANEAYLDNLQMESAVDERIGVWDWDVGTNVAVTNAAGGALFGKRADEASKRRPVETYTSLIHPDDIAHFSAGLGASVESGDPFFSEYRIVVGGSVRWIRADGSCSLDESGRPSKLLGSMIDITREKADPKTISVR